MSTSAPFARSYRRDFWQDQPSRIMVTSEKGTVRGVLKPVLDEYGVGFQVMHRFGSATAAHDIAEDDDGRDLTIPHVGDYDPSGMFMSEEDLPKRIEEYGGDHVLVSRIAILGYDLDDLPTFAASDKKKDPATSGSCGTKRGVGINHKWSRCNQYGSTHCYSLPP